MFLNMTDRNRILQKTADGLNVFTHYLGEGCKNRLFRNPFRNDSSPSCKLYKKTTSDGNKYVMKDFGDSQWYGDCFWLVAKLSGLDPIADFREVLHIIDRDLNLFILDDCSAAKHQMMQRVQPSDSPKSGGKLTSKSVYQVMPNHERCFWATYGITPEILEQYRVKSVLFCKFTREDGSSFNIRGSRRYPFFAYLLNNGEGQKFYRPGALYRFLYSGILPRPYVFGMDQLPDTGDVVYITGGEKDVMSLAAHGFSAVSLNSETARVPESVISTLAGRFKNIVFLYDTDETGRRESALRVNELCDRYSVFRVVLPLPGTKEEKDVSDYFKKGRSPLYLAELTRTAICSESNTPKTNKVSV